MGVSGVVRTPGTPSSTIPCEILDVSLGGAFIHCTAPIRIGEEILVEIHFESNSLLTGKVVRNPEETAKLSSAEKSVVRWVRGSSKSGFGVEFVSLSEDKKAFLTRLMAYFSSLKGSGV